jgi:hypothetical protein
MITGLLSSFKKENELALALAQAIAKQTSIATCVNLEVFFITLPLF